MGEFSSGLMKELYEAADISYNPSLPDEAPIPGTPFVNADARRMDRMKTAIMRILLRRAHNYMVNNKEDAKHEHQRVAETEFKIKFIPENVHHMDQAITPLRTNAAIGTNGVPYASATLDFIDRAVDAEVNTWIECFRGPVHYRGCVYEMISLSCVPTRP